MKKIYWRIEQHICGTALHVDRKIMTCLGFAGARDYYSTQAAAKAYAARYANACARMGMSSEEIYVLAGTF